jgi:hypothetical protein
LNRAEAIPSFQEAGNVPAIKVLAAWFAKSPRQPLLKMV